MKKSIRVPVLAAALASFGALLSPPPLVSDTTTPDKVIVIEGRRGPEEAAVSASSLRYLPFDVPEGVTRITVKKEFDHGPDPNQRSTVDLGLFDPRGYGPGGPGFRGWQGGMPGDLVLTGDFATSEPAYYLPGPIPAGRWHLAQWFIKSTPGGLGYKYTITLSFNGPRPPAKMPDVPVYDPGVLNPRAGWYAGNLHAHTRHSDGTRPLEELAARNKAAGFHFLAVTDHNTTRHHYHFAEAAKAHPDHLLLFGDEFTSPFGHANIIGQKPGHWFDFRIDGGDGRLPAVLRDAHRQGAVFMINHPFATCTTCSWRYPEKEWKDADAIEVWNGAWTPEDRKAVDWWDGMLKAGRRIHALGGTDYHRGEDALVPAVLVHAPRLSKTAVMDSLRRGRAFLSERPDGPKLLLTTPGGRAFPGDTVRPHKDSVVPIEVRVTGGKGLALRLVWAASEISLPVETDDATLRHAVPAASGSSYVRAELLRPNGSVVALTNPLYLAPPR